MLRHVPVRFVGWEIEALLLSVQPRYGTLSVSIKCCPLMYLGFLHSYSRQQLNDRIDWQRRIDHPSLSRITVNCTREADSGTVDDSGVGEDK